MLQLDLKTRGSRCINTPARAAKRPQTIIQWRNTFLAFPVIVIAPCVTLLHKLGQKWNKTVSKKILHSSSEFEPTNGLGSHCNFSYFHFSTIKFFFLSFRFVGSFFFSLLTAVCIFCSGSDTHFYREGPSLVSPNGERFGFLRSPICTRDLHNLVLFLASK